VARISAEHLMICGTQGGPHAWILHVPTRSWTMFTTTGGPTTAIVTRTVDHAIGFDGRVMYDFSYVAVPEAASVAQAGRDDGTSGSLTIAAEVLSRPFRLGMPGDRAMLARLFADYYLKTAAASGGTLEWSLAVLDARTGVELISADAIDAPGDRPAGATETTRVPGHRQRRVYDLNLEADEVQLRWQLVTGSPAWPLYAEIHDAALQYSVTRWRS
jgi:hypothetical protein